jgi:hypothetical protein
VQRLAGVGVPGDGGLALVGDADAVEVLAARAGVVERLAGHPAGDVPDLACVVLDPARPGEVLLELGVRPAPRPSLLVEDQARRAGRALVDGQDHRVTSGSSGVPGGPKPELKSW